MASQDGVGWPDEPTGTPLAPAGDESGLTADGLGWPPPDAGGRWNSAEQSGLATGVAFGPPRVVEHEPKPEQGHVRERERGLAQGPGAAERGEPPARVKQALSAAVSRETSGAAVTGEAATAAEARGSSTVRTRGRPAASTAGAVAAEPWGRPGEDGISEVGTGLSGEGDGVPGHAPGSRAAAGVSPPGAVLAALGGREPEWPGPPSCRVITVANQKGGVGKTTTAVNLAACLALHGRTVLVADLDPQGNASTALDIDHRAGTPSVYNVLVDDQPLAGIIQPVAGIPGLYCAPATIDLAGAEIELVPLVAREARLNRALASYDASGLDYIFIDCPPSLGLLTVNALVAATEVLIPIQCEYYALEGLEQLLRTVELVRGHLNPELFISTILLTMYDGRTRLASQVAEEVREHFGDVVLGAVIPRSVRVSEAPSYGQSVITYDPGSSGAQAYLDAAREVAYRAAALGQAG
jgi:chromosome partitioning protein